jgi:hypothetical protein
MLFTPMAARTARRPHAPGPRSATHSRAAVSLGVHPVTTQKELT